jgi:hypothetical protein
MHHLPTSFLKYPKHLSFIVSDLYDYEFSFYFKNL